MARLAMKLAAILRAWVSLIGPAHAVMAASRHIVAIIILVVFISK
jgi:hypothetical protein